MQKVLVKVGSVVAKSTDIVLAIRADPEKTLASALTEKLVNLVTYNADALTLLGHINIELSYRRLGSTSSRFGSPVVYPPSSQLLVWGKERGVTKRLEIEPNRRRDAMKPNLYNEYSYLRGSQVPITGLLFDHELQSKL